MNDQHFEKTDRAFMTALKGLREKPSGAEYRVAAEVERRLRAGDAPAVKARTSRTLPWLASALTLSLLLAVPALHTNFAPAPEPARIQLASKPAVSNVDEEIAILKEVGAWTEEDDRRVVPDADYEEVELSRATPLTRIV